ncbi:LRR receptor-like kinase plant [Medicago truncatula]|uniref:non-specific serine/threonine protein kinase n=1 Tax=Medicago truncatula TaxID=3880 RepID=A0A072TLX4_MEDTR|nr:LRR receptor-like kinase plant [Medicago truncatula]
MKQTMMRMLLHFLLVLFGVLTTFVLIQAQDQSGFISIDCGLPKDINYSSLDTGINYISDAKFIDAGVSKKIAETDIKQELQYVRSFPSGVRNCYRINVTSGIKYLIRSSFYYGNYDDLNEPPEFDLHFGPNVWDTVKLTNISHITDSEIIYTPLLDYIQPCLVNTGKGTPFISVIELRTLNNEVYVTNSAKSVVSPLRRSDVGSIANEYRYKDDVYDRIWFPSNSSFKRLHISPGTASLLLGNNYELPAIVMNTAVTSETPSAPLNFSWEADNVNDQFYLYMHFKEVEELAANETRSFNITVNDKFWYGNVTPKSLYTTAFSTKPLTGATRYLFSLSKTENSTLPPILNAYEVYKVKLFSQLETHQDDVDTITNIKNTYGVTRNWQGDPCGPVNYMWEGLNCSIDGYSIPRITSLNLASSGLTGEIPSSISKLTMLEYLDLSNNSLNGPLPDFLMQLRSLKVLNVGKNKLVGLVPIEFLDRSKSGSLSLSVDDNPDLCMTESCKKKNVVVPLVASLSALAVILLISLGIWLFRRKTDEDTSPNSNNKGSMKSKHQKFSYTEILKITDNFKTIIGEGGFGKVYFGILKDQTQVAVKRLSPSSKQGYKEFQSEAQLLMVVHHRNLVPLLGYCDEGQTKALIYKYMANGNLQQLLVKNSNILSWNERLNIAVDTAHGNVLFLASYFLHFVSVHFP